MAVRRGICEWWVEFSAENRDWLLVLLSQLFAVFMNTVAKFLETEDSAVHPLQILTIRMGFALIASVCYLWCYAPEQLPFGESSIRPLLFIRGIGGLFSVIGFYFSLMYLPLAEATVLNFLAPIGACCAVTFISTGSFSSMEILSWVMSLTGVVLIVQPEFLFGSPPGVASFKIEAAHIGIAFAIMGAVGGMCSITSIRVIGRRAHPLIGVCYFAASTLLVSVIGLVAVPSFNFNFSLSVSQWIILLAMAVFGFLMEFSYVMGLSAEASNRATCMIYSQAILAFIADSVVWKLIPSPIASVGCLWILLALTIVLIVCDKPQLAREEASKYQLAEQEDRTVPMIVVTQDLEES